MEIGEFLRRSMACTDSELIEWIWSLEEQEKVEGRQSITSVAALDRYRLVRQRLVILRVELLVRSHRLKVS